jgi:four helix bundle protein
MKIERFEDIIAWQEAQELARLLYRAMLPCKDYSFRDQIQRAVVSISNNIAEGYERKGNKELIKFLFIAKGSCAEVRSMLYLALSLRYIDNESFDDFFQRSEKVSRMLSGFIKKL